MSCAILRVASLLAAAAGCLSDMDIPGPKRSSPSAGPCGQPRTGVGVRRVAPCGWPVFMMTGSVSPT